MIGGRKQYKDVSVPINNALNRDKGTFAEHSGELIWFKNQVNHEADWDIKRKDPWERTIGSTFPGDYNTTVVLYGTFTTPEELGNITYGYLGSAAGFGEKTLIAGSIYAAGVWSVITDKAARTNEFNDHDAIRKGIDWYYGR